MYGMGAQTRFVPKKYIQPLSAAICSALNNFAVWAKYF